MLAAVNAATAALSAGEAYPITAAELSGRRFALRLPFGCRSDAAGNALSYEYDGEDRALRLAATPQDWTEWAAPVLGEPDAELVEGFWVTRPWQISEHCPATAAPATAAPASAVPPTAVPRPPAADARTADVAPAAPLITASPETVGIAQVFLREGSRLLRRAGRPYETTLRLGEGEAPTPQGYRLVLQGRFAADPEPVQCWSDHPDRRPTCLVRVEFDRVAFEDPAGKTLAEWR